jgi:hypothetical protein
MKDLLHLVGKGEALLSPEDVRLLTAWLTELEGLRKERLNIQDLRKYTRVLHRRIDSLQAELEAADQRLKS